MEKYIKDIIINSQPGVILKCCKRELKIRKTKQIPLKYVIQVLQLISWGLN